MISPEYEFFLIELVNCSSFSCLNWENDLLISDLQEIAEIEPEILSCAEQEIEGLAIVCSIFDGPGGLLDIVAEDKKYMTKVTLPFLLNNWIPFLLGIGTVALRQSSCHTS